MERNIFIDLGYEADEAVDLLNRSNAMSKVREYIVQHGSNSMEHLEVPWRTIEDVVFGRLDRLHMGKLSHMLHKIAVRNEDATK